MLERGEATRQIIIDTLPATVSEIVAIRQLRADTVRIALRRMADRGEVERIGGPAGQWVKIVRHEIIHEDAGNSTFNWRRPGIDSPLPLDHGIVHHHHRASAANRGTEVVALRMQNGKRFTAS